MKRLKQLILLLLLSHCIAACSKTYETPEQYGNFKVVTLATESHALFAEHDRGGSGYNYDYKIYYKDQLLFQPEKGKAANIVSFLQKAPPVIHILTNNEKNGYLLYEKNGKLVNMPMNRDGERVDSPERITQGLYGTLAFSHDTYIAVDHDLVIVAKEPYDFTEGAGFTWFSPNRHIVARMVTTNDEHTITSIKLLNLLTGQQQKLNIAPVTTIRLRPYEELAYEATYRWLDTRFEWVKEGGDYVTLRQKATLDKFEFDLAKERQLRDAARNTAQ